MVSQPDFALKELIPILEILSPYGFFFSFSPKSCREVRHGETGPFAQGHLAAASPEEESPDFLASCHTCEGLLALMTVKALQ